MLGVGRMPGDAAKRLLASVSCSTAALRHALERRSRAPLRRVRDAAPALAARRLRSGRRARHRIRPACAARASACSRVASSVSLRTIAASTAHRRHAPAPRGGRARSGSSSASARQRFLIGVVDVVKAFEPHGRVGVLPLGLRAEFFEESHGRSPLPAAFGLQSLIVRPRQESACVTELLCSITPRLIRGRQRSPTSYQNDGLSERRSSRGGGRGLATGMRQMMLRRTFRGQRTVATRHRLI